jgi:hypothetical protein
MFEVAKAWLLTLRPYESQHTKKTGRLFHRRSAMLSNQQRFLKTKVSYVKPHAIQLYELREQAERQPKKRP